MFVNVTLKSGSPAFLDINQVCLIHQLPKKHHHFLTKPSLVGPRDHFFVMYTMKIPFGKLT